MNILAAFKGQYVTAVELGDKTATLTIGHVSLVKLEGEDGTIRERPVVYFSETPRGWVLCKTTALSVAAMFGTETNGWTGKRVTLYAADVQVGRERKPGLRVKGSPDLAAAVTFELKLPKKKTQSVTLSKTEAP